MKPSQQPRAQNVRQNQSESVRTVPGLVGLRALDKLAWWGIFVETPRRPEIEHRLAALAEGSSEMCSLSTLTQHSVLHRWGLGGLGYGRQVLGAPQHGQVGSLTTPQTLSESL